MSVFDISPEINEKIAVFPGDQSFEHHQSHSIAGGDGYDLSSIKTTLHLGSHADAPSHYGLDKSIEQADLTRYFGSAQVIEVQCQPGARIQPTDFNVEIKAPRVLFKTNSFLNPNQWHNDFNSLSPDLIDSLQDKGVFLIGIDTPSIDPADSKELESHKQILKYNISNLEGLYLKDVPSGIYQLIALPLKIKSGEASPVRAILVSNDYDLRTN